jgi:hypothetical protein
MNVRSLAFDMVRAVELFLEKTKEFFYRVMLLGYRCPKCNGSLIMVSEGMCRCTSCGKKSIQHYPFRDVRDAAVSLGSK